MEKLGLEYFDLRWKDAALNGGMQQTKETWDRLAAALAKDPPEMERIKKKHCRDVAEYLISKGVLDGDSVVADIGCGTGNYAVEFGKRVKQVDCSDISPVMIDYCRKNAKTEGLTNLSYKACDFLECDIDKEGWRKKYNLVFTSITPAVTGLKAVEKMNAMARGFCFNSSFIYRRDDIREAVLHDVFKRDTTSRKRGETTYYLFNILWQLGYTPEICYYREEMSAETELTKDYAKQMAASIVKNGEVPEEVVKRTYDYLFNNYSFNGRIKNTRVSVFAWTLWKAGE